MLTLTLPPDIAERVQKALIRSGKREIGGVMMGEHVGFDSFVVRDLTVHRRGTFASFVRRIEEAWASLSQFFDKTRWDYQRFNYIGEWHSHPCYEPFPSPRDHRSMMEIALDRSVGANFVALMIVKLTTRGALDGTVHTYLPDGRCEESQLVIQGCSGRDNE